MLRFHVISLFPETITPYIESGMLRRAQQEKKVSYTVYDLRTFSRDKHKKVDARPYGGGPGMVLSVEPIVRAVSTIVKKINRRKNTKTKAIIFSPRGKQFDTAFAKKLSGRYTDIILICGRYEGIDARVKKIVRAEEVSIGPFVLTGGEVPALVVLDATSRHVDGVLGNEDSLEEKRDASREVYTRPEVFVHEGKRYRVPKVLLSGDHKDIAEWQKKRSQ